MKIWENTFYEVEESGYVGLKHRVDGLRLLRDGALDRRRHARAHLRYTENNRQIHWKLLFRELSKNLNWI